MYLGPRNAGRFGQMGVSANQPNFKFFNNFLYKIKLESGLFYEKIANLFILRPQNAGRFEQIGVSTNQPKMNQF